MNTEHDDPILDACLEELLSGNRPPDLTARILRAWDQRKSAASLADVASPATSNEPLVDLPRVDVARSGPSARPQPMASRSLGGRRLTKIGLAAAASVLVAGAAVWSVVKWQSAAPAGLTTVAEHQTDPLDSMATENPFATDGFDRTNSQPEETDTAVGSVPFDRDIEITPPNSQPTNSQPTSSQPTTGRPVAPKQSPAVSLPSVASLPASSNLAAEQIEPLTSNQIVTLIDRQLREAWSERGVEPGPRVGDQVWCQRVCQRLLGRMPTSQEVERLVDDPAEDRRQQFVARLLSAPQATSAFAQHWSSIWARALVGGAKRDAKHRRPLQRYLETALISDASFDRITSDLLTAKGRRVRGAGSFLVAHLSEDEQAVRTTGHVARVFLGQQLACAQCHDHPYEPGLAQQKFWEFNAFFRQLKLAQPGGRRELVDIDFRGDVHFETPAALVKVALPIFPGEDPLPRSGLLADANRRERLAELLVRSQEFRRSIVNHCWTEVFGFGLAAAGHERRETVPQHSELLDRLGEQFAAHDFDLVKLAGWLALSEPFSRASTNLAQTLDATPAFGGSPLFERFYERRTVRADTFQVALARTADYRDLASASSAKLGTAARLDRGALGNRDAAIPKKISTNAGQHTVDPAYQQVFPRGPGTRIQQILDSGLKRNEKVDHLFWVLLERDPHPSERQAINKLWSKQSEREVLVDVWWALLNNAEFAG